MTPTAKPKGKPITPKQSNAIYGGVYEGIMRLRIRLQRQKPSEDVDFAVAQSVNEIHALVVGALNALAPKGTR